MVENEALERIYDILNGVGFELLKEHEIIFNPPSSKIHFLQKDLIYFGYNDTRIIINKKSNYISLKRSIFANVEKSWLIGEYFIPQILQYLKEIYPKEVRLYKIKKILNK